MARIQPYKLLEDIPFDDTRRRIERLIAKEMGLPLHKRKLFFGLSGDYEMIDEHGNTVWASEYCHKLFVSTCPRALHRRARP